MSLRNYQPDSLDLSSSTSGVAIPVDKNRFGFSYQVVVTGASGLSGTVTLQATIDLGSPTNWSDISGTSAAITGNGAVLWSVTERHNFKWIRATWTRTGGSGTMTTTFNENE